MNRFKARLVIKNYEQKVGIDYFEIFIPISELDIVWIIVSFSANNY